MKNFIQYFGGSLKDANFLAGGGRWAVTKNQCRGGGLPKKGAWTVCRFKGGLIRKKGVMFLRGEG